MLSRVRILALLAAVTLAGCMDATEPSASVRTGGPALSLSDPPLVVEVLQRTTPLPRAYVAARVIGRAGGTIEIPQAGFSIRFPRNAIEGGVPTLVTVTALPGGDVAYEFQPHGLVFRRQPVITQELRGTEASQHPEMREMLEGAYFTDVSALGGGKARVRETRPTELNVSGWKMKFGVEHFSGYLASARRSGYISSSGNLVPFGN